jgi:hypothetical protein
MNFFELFTVQFAEYSSFSTFGKSGDIATIIKPVSMDDDGTNLYVADSFLNRINIYSNTRFSLFARK